MRLSNNRYEEIKEIVINFLIKYDISCIPINGFEIATKMGINIQPYPRKRTDLFKKMSQDGFTLFTEPTPMIYYNPMKPYQRLNNTIVHEIGHIILNHTQESDLAEAEVNFFAKYLLAPPVLVHKLGLQSAEEISKFFQISELASKIAWQYYICWNKKTNNTFQPYEIKLINLFQENIGDLLQKRN